jgi:hypothetical protein
MLQVLEIVAIVLLALTLVPPLAHALELPGKLRLSRDQYVAVQEIYYPGFTIGGFAEIGAIVATGALVFLMPENRGFRLTLVALVMLLVMHGLYWLLTHPVNKFWVKDANLGGAGKAFFGVGRAADAGGDWAALRDRWEYSHVARAVCAVLSLVALLAAITEPSS